MAGFDLDAAVSQARTGVTPPGSERYPLRAVTMWSNAIGGAVLGLAAIAFGIGNVIYSLNTGEVWAPDILFAIFKSVGVVLLIETLFFLGAGVGFLVFGIRSFGPVLNRNDYFLLLTPDSFAEVEGKKVQGAAFVDVADASLGNNAVAQFSLRNGRSFEITLNKYGKAPDLYARIRSGAQAAIKG